MSDLLALTLWPEWAWAIDLPFLFAKRVENRGWAPPSAQVGPEAPWIALHAGREIGGKNTDDAMVYGLDCVQAMAEAAGLSAQVRVNPARLKSWAIRVWRGNRSVQAQNSWYIPNRPGVEIRPIRTSAIIGLIRVVRVLRPGEEGDEPGVRGWKVPDAYGWVFHYRPLKSPVSAAGKQKLWKVDAATAAAVWRQAEADHG